MLCLTNTVFPWLLYGNNEQFSVEHIVIWQMLLSKVSYKWGTKQARKKTMPKGEITYISVFIFNFLVIL